MKLEIRKQPKHQTQQEQNTKMILVVDSSNLDFL